MAISPSFVARINAGQGDNDAPVRAGMELFGWQVPDVAWREVLQQAIDSLEGAESSRPGGLVLSSLFAGGGAGFLLYTSELFALAMLTGVGGVAVAGGALAWLFNKQGRAQTLRSATFQPPPRVFVTATGITAGHAAAAWSKDRLRLARLEIEPPVRVVLEFDRPGLRGGVETWELPVPDEMVNDADELVLHLQDRIAGKQGVSNRP